MTAKRARIRFNYNQLVIVWYDKITTNKDDYKKIINVLTAKVSSILLVSN